MRVLFIKSLEKLKNIITLSTNFDDRKEFTPINDNACTSRYEIIKLLPKLLKDGEVF